MTEKCRCCQGAGMQRNDAGLLDRCPACLGSGRWTKPEDPDSAPEFAPLPKPTPSIPDWIKRIPPADRDRAYYCDKPQVVLLTDPPPFRFEHFFVGPRSSLN